MLRTQMTVFDVVSCVFGAVCQQGTNLSMPTTSGRFVLMTTFLATLALFTSYSASIVTLIQSRSKSIQALNNFVDSPLMLGIHDVDWIRMKFLNENDKIFQQLYERKIQSQNSDSWIADTFVGLEQVRSELFGFLIELPEAYQVISRTYTESEKCSLNELNVFRLPMNTITVKKNSGFKELIKQR